MGDLTRLLRSTRRHLMTGVSYMIPFVVTGGILMAVSVMFFGQGREPGSGYLKDIYDMGMASFSLMVPILAAYIGFSIADRPALAPSAIAGWVGAHFGAGFFAGIIAGLLGGIVVFYLKKLRVPPALRSIMPIFVIPILGTFITAGLMTWVLAAPIATASFAMATWLRDMQSGSIFILATVMGLMIAIDMGGPVNKVAYAFVVMCIGERLFHIAGISAVGVAVPSIGMGLATLLASKQYSREERAAGKASILMGTVGITEGAIPFAVADPLRVIPSIMIGTACGTVTATLFDVKCYAAWGGLIVLPVVNGRLGFMVALFVGSIVTVALVTILKSIGRKKEDGNVDKGDGMSLKFEES